MSKKERPPLFERVKAGLEEAIAWQRGEGELRVTRYDSETGELLSCDMEKAGENLAQGDVESVGSRKRFSRGAKMPQPEDKVRSES